MKLNKSIWWTVWIANIVALGICTYAWKDAGYNFTTISVLILFFANLFWLAANDPKWKK